MAARSRTSLRPEVVLNAAAYTAVDRAESEPDVAFRVNAAAVEELGRIAAQAGARVVHFSTDHVFDGTARAPYREDDPPNPLNAYGRSKLAGERALAESGARYLIVRAQWLFGAHGRSFPRTMWERAGARQPSRVVDDQWGRPTCTADLAAAVWSLIRREAAGVLHVANAGTASWYDVARRVYAQVGVEALVTPCGTADYLTPAARPARAVLDTTDAEALLPAPLPRWEDALQRFLAACSGATANRPGSPGSG